MSRKLTREIFIERARKIHGDRYDYSSVVYVGNKIEIIIVCSVHGEFLQTPNDHLSVHGCWKCGGTKKLTRTEFIDRSIVIHKSKYDYSKVIYVNSWSKVIIICPFHGEFLQSPNSHLMGSGCRKCTNETTALKTRRTKEEFIIMAKKIHKNKYNYDKVDYKGNHVPVTLNCHAHGEFPQTPTAHLSGAGCPSCVGLKRLTTEEFIIRANKIHDNIYNYNKTVYINNHTEISVDCKEHGEFKTMPRDHLRKNGRGSGCPDCQKSKGELLIAKILNGKNIEYKKQKTFIDCINPETKYRLKYDFYLPEKNILIEYNGQQHYRCDSRWHQNKETLAQQQFRDQIKKDYAIHHGYKFLVIKYDENIEEILENTVLVTI